MDGIRAGACPCAPLLMLLPFPLVNPEPEAEADAAADASPNERGGSERGGVLGNGGDKLRCLPREMLSSCSGTSGEASAAAGVGWAVGAGSAYAEALLPE